jgi:hypothetical protein
MHDVLFDFLLPLVKAPLGPYHICTKLSSVCFKVLCDIHEKAKASSYLISLTPDYRLVYTLYVVMNVAHHRLFGIIDECELKKPCNFFHLKFENKGIDAVNISNILNHKVVQSCIMPYFNIQSTPCISYRYTPTFASELFNYKQTLQCNNYEILQSAHVALPNLITVPLVLLQVMLI